jgi:hypothetical protein
LEGSAFSRRLSIAQSVLRFKRIGAGRCCASAIQTLHDSGSIIILG